MSTNGTGQRTQIEPTSIQMTFDHVQKQVNGGGIDFSINSLKQFDCCCCLLFNHYVWLFATPWTAARQASLFFTISWIALKFMSTESVILSNYLILCCPLLLLSSIFPSIRVFLSESVLRIRWPKYQSFIFSISPSNEYSELIFFRIDWFMQVHRVTLLIKVEGLVGSNYCC